LTHGIFIYLFFKNLKKIKIKKKNNFFLKKSKKPQIDTWHID